MKYVESKNETRRVIELQEGPAPITITSQSQADTIISAILGGKAENGKNNENATKTYNNEGK